VTNLSPKGIFLRTLPAVDQGALIDIKLNLENGMVQAKGRVCWKNHSTTQSGDANYSRPSGLGIEFIEFDDGKDILTSYFAKQPAIKSES
jgi:Tfp pilus assembly protein PilZ